MLMDRPREGGEAGDLPEGRRRVMGYFSYGEVDRAVAVAALTGAAGLLGIKVTVCDIDTEEDRRRIDEAAGLHNDTQRFYEQVGSDGAVALAADRTDVVFMTHYDPTVTPPDRLAESLVDLHEIAASFCIEDL